MTMIEDVAGPMAKPSRRSLLVQAIAAVGATAARPVDAKGGSALGDFPKGAILVFDGKLSAMTVRSLLNPEFVHLRGQSPDAVVDEPYHRLWAMPAFNLDAYHARGAARVAIIMDVSAAQIAGNFPRKPRPTRRRCRRCSSARTRRTTCARRSRRARRGI